MSTTKVAFFDRFPPLALGYLTVIFFVNHVRGRNIRKSLSSEILGSNCILIRYGESITSYSVLAVIVTLCISEVRVDERQFDKLGAGSRRGLVLELVLVLDLDNSRLVVCARGLLPCLHRWHKVLAYLQNLCLPLTASTVTNTNTRWLIPHLSIQRWRVKGDSPQRQSGFAGHRRRCSLRFVSKFVQ